MQAWKTSSANWTSSLDCTRTPTWLVNWSPNPVKNSVVALGPSCTSWLLPILPNPLLKPFKNTSSSSSSCLESIRVLTVVLTWKQCSMNSHHASILGTIFLNGFVKLIIELIFALASLDLIVPHWMNAGTAGAVLRPANLVPINNRAKAPLKLIHPQSLASTPKSPKSTKTVRLAKTDALATVVLPNFPYFWIKFSSFNPINATTHP